MTEFDRINARWGMHLPDGYRRMHDAGLFDRTSETALRLPDVRWMSPEQIAGHQPLVFMTDALVPFAREARASHWAWWPTCPLSGEVPIIYSPRDSNTAEVYAADFAGFLCRKLFAELSDLEVDDLGTEPTSGVVRAYFTAKVRSVSPYLPADWVAALAAAARRPLRVHPDGRTGVLTHAETLATLRSLLPDPRVGLEFVQFPQDVRPTGPSGLYKSVTLFGPGLTSSAVADLLRPFGDVDEHALVISDRAHGPLTVRIGHVAASNYNRDLLAAVGLDRPPSAWMECPVETSDTLLPILDRLRAVATAVVSVRGVEPLSDLLTSPDPWGDLRWA